MPMASRRRAVVSLGIGRRRVSESSRRRGVKADFWQLPVLPPEREFKHGTWARRPTNGAEHLPNGRAGERAATLPLSVVLAEGRRGCQGSRESSAPPLELQKPQRPCKPDERGFHGGKAGGGGVEAMSPRPRAIMLLTSLATLARNYGSCNLNTALGRN